MYLRCSDFEIELFLHNQASYQALKNRGLPLIDKDLALDTTSWLIYGKGLNYEQSSKSGLQTSF